MKRFLKRIPIIHKIYHKLQKVTTPPSKVFFKNKEKFKGLKVLEIGGPSAIFERDNLIPLYKWAGSVDNCNFNAKNFWSNIEAGDNFFYDRGRRKGKQFIQDAVCLDRIGDCTYDVLCASHVIEHIANPIKALLEWKRALKPNSFLIVIAPNPTFTYDRKRPLTTLAHLIEDYENNMEETDTTHFEEIIKLHDLSADMTVETFEEHKRRTLNNAVERIAHHHVFDSNLLKTLLEYVGFVQVEIEHRKPFHIIALARLI